jgi:hypothetical protein
MKSLTKIFLAATLITSAGYTTAKPHKTIKATVAEIVDRHLSGFHAINVAGPFDVDIVQGGTESVKIEAPTDVMEHILTDVNNGVLKIYNKHDMWNWGNWFGLHKKILVHVVIKDVNDINISGSGDVYCRDGLTANSLRLNISGSGDMTGKVSVKTLESKITGSGDMKLAGNAENSTVSVVGSGDFTARNLATISTAVRVSGSGDAAVNASDRLDAAVNGSGDINYSGSPKNVNKHKSGSGDISGH